MKTDGTTEHIEQLIRSKDAENNYLAITLMRTQLGIPFKEAFIKLQEVALENVDISSGYAEHIIEILDYSISFITKIATAPVHEYTYFSIYREVRDKNKRLKELDVKVFIDCQAENIPNHLGYIEKEIAVEALIGKSILYENIEELFETN